MTAIPQRITAHKPMHIKESNGRKAFRILNAIFLSFMCLIMLYPVLYVIVCSFSDETAILRGQVSVWPVGAHVKAYLKVFNYPQLWVSYRNTVFYTIAGTAINLFLTTCGAWVLCQKKLPGRRALTLMCTFTMFFSGGMIPTFMVVQELNLLDTPWAMLLPGAVSTYNMILMRTFFQGIPTSLVEAAELDGCNDFMILIRIVLPLSLASLMTIGMYYAVAHWNNYFSAVIYISDIKLYPLQIILRQVVLQNEIVENATSDEMNMAEGIKYATIVVAMLPMLCVYPFVQKFFIKGMLIGSVKE